MKKNSTLLFIAAALLFFGGTIGASAQTQIACTKDDDCPANLRYCTAPGPIINGVTQYFCASVMMRGRNNPNAACGGTTDGICPAGQECKNTGLLYKNYSCAIIPLYNYNTYIRPTMPAPAARPAMPTYMAPVAPCDITVLPRAQNSASVIDAIWSFVTHSR